MIESTYRRQTHLLRGTLETGAVATVATTVTVAICRAIEDRNALAPLNAVSHILWGDKAEAEQHVLRLMPKALIIRASEFFGPWDQGNFVRSVLRTLSRRQPVFAANDVVVSPTYLPDAIHACLDLLIDEESGVWHVANQGEVTWAELARRIAFRSHHDVSKIVERSTVSLGLIARRPAYSALGSERGSHLRTLNDAIDGFFADSSELDNPAHGALRQSDRSH